MKITIKQSTLNLLIGLIAILSIATIYLFIEKFNESKISKLNKDKVCTAPKKICAFIKYKYTDALEAEIILVPGEYYYLDEKKKDFNKYWSNWLKNKSNEDNQIYNDKSFIIENFLSSINTSKKNIIIKLDDKDGFKIEEMKIDFSKSRSKLEDLIDSGRFINIDGIGYAYLYAFKKKITMDNYKRIDYASITYTISLEDLPN